MSPFLGGIRSKYKVEYMYKDGSGYGYEFVYSSTAIGAKSKLVRDMNGRITITSVVKVEE